MIDLRQGDCLCELPKLKDGSVDLILTDLPYGVLNKGNKNAQWDCQIPLDPLWEQFWRVLKPNGACVLFSQGMFTANLMVSQPRNWRYNLIWDKCRASGFLNSKKMPLRNHEDICVFYRELPTYNPQMVKAEPGKESHTRGKAQKEGAKTNQCYGSFGAVEDGDLSMKYPGSIMKFPRPHCTGNHPTEKSVDLCRWLIRTYTNEEETVLDATMGSGTTMVAAALENRNGIGIELEQKYFDVATKRVNEVVI